MHRAVGGWPIFLAVGALAVGVAVAAVVLLTRRPESATEGAVSASPGGSPGICYSGSDAATADIGLDPAVREDSAALDDRILGMLRQKGEPMPQGEVADNLGMAPDELGSWLAGMERREMLRRTWDPQRSTYLVHRPAQA
jgi:hypothetical protein